MPCSTVTTSLFLLIKTTAFPVKVMKTCNKKQSEKSKVHVELVYICKGVKPRCKMQREECLVFVFI